MEHGPLLHSTMWSSLGVNQQCVCSYMFNKGATANNLTKVIIKAVCDLIGMLRDDIATRMMAFGAGKSHITSPFG
jgi:hypothetical protein